MHALARPLAFGVTAAPGQALRAGRRGLPHESAARAQGIHALAGLLFPLTRTCQNRWAAG